MKKLAIIALLMTLLLGFGTPAYAKRHHNHVNKQARATQKHNKARAKQLRKEVRANQKSRSRTPYQ